MQNVDFLTITMNPALDVMTTIDKVIHTDKLRCSEAMVYGGGGGINVARVLHKLDMSVLALFPAGGARGKILCDILTGERFPYRCIAVQGETRESLSVHEISTTKDFRFVLPGPTLLDSEWRACYNFVHDLPRAPRFVVLSGALPPGVPPEFYADITRLMKQRGSTVVLDATGIALKKSLEVGVDILKQNEDELENLLARPQKTAADWSQAADFLLKKNNTKMLALTLGNDGAALFTTQHAYTSTAPTVAVKTTVGAGDSFLAGLLWGLYHNHNAEESLRYANATAAIAVSSQNANACNAVEMRRMARLIELKPIHR